MSIKQYMHLILGVLSDLKVIGTVIVCILVITFAKYITTYKKKPPKPKKKKAAPEPAPAAPAEAAAPAENTEESEE